MTSKTEQNISCAFTAVTILILLYAFIGGHAIASRYQRTVTATVKSKERVAAGQSGRFMIWTQEGDVFEVADNRALWLFDSANRYGQMDPGHRYRLRLCGWRWPITSSFENIIRVEAAE